MAMSFGDGMYLNNILTKQLIKYPDNLVENPVPLAYSIYVRQRNNT